MNPTLNIWCLSLSILFTLLYLILGWHIFKKYKPNITYSQKVVVVLIFLNLICKVIGFATI